MERSDIKVCYLIVESILDLNRKRFFENSLDNQSVFYTSEIALKKGNYLFFYIKINQDCCEFVSDTKSFKCKFADRVSAIRQVRERNEVFEAIAKHYPEYKRIDPKLYLYCQNDINRNINIKNEFIIVRPIDESPVNNPILCGGIYIIWNKYDIQMVDWYTKKSYKIREEDISYLFDLIFLIILALRNVTIT